MFRLYFTYELILSYLLYVQLYFGYIEEVNNIANKHFETMLGSNSERYKELKQWIENVIANYKEAGLHNVPLKELREK